MTAGSVEGGVHAKQRTGLFTSGVVSTREGRRIALFFSGRQHAGENLKEVLAQRATGLAPPIQMCDALSRNPPAELETIVANCLAHGWRQFVEVAEHSPEQCRHVLEALTTRSRGRCQSALQNQPGLLVHFRPDGYDWQAFPALGVAVLRFRRDRSLFPPVGCGLLGSDPVGAIAGFGFFGSSIAWAD